MMEILEAIAQVVTWLYDVAMPTVLFGWFPAVMLFLWNLTPSSWPGPLRLLVYPLALYLLVFGMRRLRLTIHRLRRGH